jgi:hypothetical protein
MMMQCGMRKPRTTGSNGKNKWVVGLRDYLIRPRCGDEDSLERMLAVLRFAFSKGDRVDCTSFWPCLRHGLLASSLPLPLAGLSLLGALPPNPHLFLYCMSPLSSSISLSNGQSMLKIINFPNNCGPLQLQ